MRSRAPRPRRWPRGPFSNSVMPASVRGPVPIGVCSLHWVKPSATLRTRLGIRKNRAVPETPHCNGVIMGKLDGKRWEPARPRSGMPPAGAKLFVEEGAHVFIQARRLDDHPAPPGVGGHHVKAVQGDAAELDDLD